MFQNRFFPAFHAAHLAFRPAAAAAIEIRNHILIEGPQIAGSCDQAVAVAICVIAGEHRRDAAAAVRRQIRQLPDTHAVQVLPDQQHIAPAPAFLRQRRHALALQAGDGVLVLLQQPIHPPGRLAGLHQLCGECGADQLVLLMAAAEEIQGPLTADHLDPHTGAEPDAAEQLDQADLAGALHMDAAAGAGIVSGNLHDPHRPGQRPLGAVENIRQFLGRRRPDLQGDIAVDGLVGFALDFRQILRRDDAVKVNGGHVGAHVETHIVMAVGGVDQSGDDVLAGVLLHQVEAVVVVHDALDGFSHNQGVVAQVEHPLPRLPDVEHLCSAKGSPVRILAAALGVEGGLIQLYLPDGAYGTAAACNLGGFAGHHPGGKSCQPAVFIKKLLCFHEIVPRFSICKPIVPYPADFSTVIFFSLLLFFTIL